MRLLLVEDEKDLAQAICITLRNRNYIVDWAEDGKIAWDYLETINNYVVAIIDWMLPNLSGLELCKIMRQHNYHLPVIILTARSSIADRVIGLDAGADDYLNKPFGMEELLARVRALQRRSPVFQSTNLQVGSLLLNYDKFTMQNINELNKNSIVLTAKEFQLLEYFMQHPGQILSQDQIRLRLWDLSDDCVSNVVAAQVRLLRRKLVECNYPDAIQTIRGLGYRLNI
ncbi:MAG: DNA-binding response regulator [Oscillatoriales cyanobacterium]|nr:MAG: DNA-binding response regulator [Oscillatoriales cyanobacterium]